MRLLLRWIFNLAATLSLLLCGASAALWVAGSKSDGYGCLRARYAALSVIAEDGVVQSKAMRYYDGRRTSRARGWYYRPGYASPLVRLAPFSFDDDPLDGDPLLVPVSDGFDVRCRVSAGAGAGHFFGLRPLSARGTDPPDFRYGYLVMPDWLLTVVWAMVPLLWLIRRFAPRRRSPTGACSRCGYDLRATPVAPENGGALFHRCPECGTERDKPAPSSLRSGVHRP